MFLLNSRLFLYCDYKGAWEQIFPKKSGTYYPVQTKIVAGLYLEN